MDTLQEAIEHLDGQHMLTTEMGTLLLDYIEALRRVATAAEDVELYFEERTKATDLPPLLEGEKDLLRILDSALSAIHNKSRGGGV